MAKVPIDITVNAKGNAPTFFGKMEAQLKGLRKGDTAQALDEIGKLARGGGAIAALSGSLSLINEYWEKYNENVKSASALTRQFASDIALNQTLTNIPIAGTLSKFIANATGQQTWEQLLEQENTGNDLTQRLIAGRDRQRGLKLDMKASERPGGDDSIADQQKRFVASITDDFAKQYDALGKEAETLKGQRDSIFHMFEGDLGRTAAGILDEIVAGMEKERELLKQKFEQRKSNNLDKLIDDQTNLLLKGERERQKRTLELVEADRQKQRDDLESFRSARIDSYQSGRGLADLVYDIRNANRPDPIRFSGGIAPTFESNYLTGAAQASAESGRDEPLRNVEQNTQETNRILETLVGKVSTLLENSIPLLRVNLGAR